MALMQWVSVLAMALVVPQVGALDFDREIQKQERKVRVKYIPPERSLASFYKTYSQCRSQREQVKRMQCNRRYALARYEAYRSERQRRLREAQVQTGEMQVVLESRLDRVRRPTQVR